MASFATACRLSARMVGRKAPTTRGLRTSARCLAAQNFTMPALSPTMTEGNIATWKVKEGASFSAGDVLLEIETDKATMDVEAQEDGVIMKIVTGDGSKSVQVGTRIAVLAESDDDVSSLELPPDESPKGQGQAQATQDESKEATTTDTTASSNKASPPPSDGKKHEQKYPLYPSVQHLVNQHKLDADTVARITPTGPQGRLLKGDVLAHVGAIPANTPTRITERFTKLSHLDLSNIKVAATPEPKTAPAAAKDSAAAAAPPPPPPEDLDIAVPVSLSKVLDTQRRIQDTLGVFMPLSTFIARAADVANDELPAAPRAATADELFDKVLGLDKLKPRGAAFSPSSRGFYLPQTSALPESSFLTKPAATTPPRKKQPAGDIIDILASGPGKKTSTASSPPKTVQGLSATGTNVFSLTVPKGEAKRATVFLERVKVILEKEPGRLVL